MDMNAEFGKWYKETFGDIKDDMLKLPLHKAFQAGWKILLDEAEKESAKAKIRLSENGFDVLMPKKEDSGKAIVVMLESLRDNYCKNKPPCVVCQSEGHQSHDLPGLSAFNIAVDRAKKLIP